MNALFCKELLDRCCCEFGAIICHTLIRDAMSCKCASQAVYQVPGTIVCSFSKWPSRVSVNHNQVVHPFRMEEVGTDTLEGLCCRYDWVRWGTVLWCCHMIAMGAVCMQNSYGWCNACPEHSHMLMFVKEVEIILVKVRSTCLSNDETDSIVQLLFLAVLTAIKIFPNQSGWNINLHNWMSSFNFFNYCFFYSLTRLKTF